MASLVHGLRELAARDALDMSIIDTVAEIVLRDGVEAEVTFLHRTTARHDARVVYRVDVGKLDVPFRLRVVERASNRSVERDLGRHDLWYAKFRLGSLDLLRDAVRIRPKSGPRAEVYNKGVLNPLVIPYQELFGP